MLTFDAFVHIYNDTLTKYDVINNINNWKSHFILLITFYELVVNLTIWWNLHFDMEIVIPKRFQSGSFAWMHETDNDFFKKIY